MTRKAGIVLAALALLAFGAFGAFAATGFGAGSGGSAKVKRPDAIRARASFGSAAAKSSKHGDKVLYGSATVSVPPGGRTVTIGPCPKKSHIVNGTLAALHGTQAQYLTIRGFGLASQKASFVDVNNASATTNPPDGFAVKAVAFIICER
jgi:hypothetical protein